MPRRPARVTQADIARAIRAIAQTGARMAVEIGTDGTIRIVPIAISEIYPQAAKARVGPKREFRL